MEVVELMVNTVTLEPFARLWCGRRNDRERCGGEGGRQRRSADESHVTLSYRKVNRKTKLKLIIFLSKV